MADPATLVIVLTGNSRAFSAGAERSLLNLTNTADRATAKEPVHRAPGSAQRLREALFAAAGRAGAARQAIDRELGQMTVLLPPSR